MTKIKKLFRNWPRIILQWGVLAALVLFLTGVIQGKEAANPEAYCPMGGIQALTTWLVSGSLPCSMTTLQIMMGVVLAACVVLFSKLFCGYLCPLGTVQDLLIKLRKSFGWKKGIVIKSGSVLDKILRAVKYVLVFWIFYMTASSSELFCKNLDPYYAVATGFKGEITLWMSIITVSVLLLMGFFVNNFWCKYICPLGAISNSLKFWISIVLLLGFYYVLGLLGLNISWAVLLGAYCLVAYLHEILAKKPAPSLLMMMKDENLCNHCGSCSKHCPYGIDINSFGSSVNSVDCTLCGECAAVCKRDALKVGVVGTKGSRALKVVPAVLAVLLVCFGIWMGGKFELPTIDVTWGIEKLNEDGNTTQLIDPSTLKTTEITGLRSVKCYGSSMAFKAKLQKIQGVYGVKTYVAHHRAVVTYDPAKTNPDKIQEAIYVPSKFRVATPNHLEVPDLKIVTIRTEKMYDKLDINYLGMQMRQSGKRIYGLESEFACPLIVRVYMDPSENLDEDWFEEIVEKDVLEMPVHGGGVNEIELDYEFIELEDEVGSIRTEDFIRNMFSPFKVEWKKRKEQAAGKKEYIYEIVDKNYEKPIILRNMPFLSNHLSTNEGVIGVYLQLNSELQPAIQIRYAKPMTEARLWELMTMPEWTITYKADDVRKEGAKIAFKTPGVSYEFAYTE